MITSKYINIFIIGILVFALIFTGLLVFLPSAEGIAVTSRQPQYVSGLFDKNKISTIDIKVDEAEWQKMLDSAQEQYISCDVVINGTTVESVGIRPKGNSSLSTVARSDSDRFSFKFEFDHFIKGQNYLGLDKMVINNVQSDASYMKDYLSYDLMTFMGVKTPLFAYTNVTVNGKSWGFYIAVEALEESFAQRNYGTDYGMLYKPESMEMGGNEMKDFTAPDKIERNTENKTAGNAEKNKKENADNNTVINPQQNSAQQNSTQQNSTQQNNPQNDRNNGFGGRGMNGFGAGGPGGASGGGTDLKYTDDKTGSYSNIFDNEVFKGTDSDYSKVIEALKNLNSGTELEKYIDVDATLRYLAANTVLVNLDSYFSSMKHNYYLYEEDGRLTMLPWDYNLAFGGFQSGSADAAVNFPIDTPVSGIDMSERPMLAKLLEVDEYKDKYHEYLKQIVDEYFNNGRYQTTIDNINTLISDYVKEDPSAFYTFQQYTDAVSAIKEFGRLRALSIDGQLKGTIPSTTVGQTKDSDKLIDASSVNLSTMGSQGGGAGGGWGGNRQNRNNNNEAVNNAQQNTGTNNNSQQNAQQSTQQNPPQPDNSQEQSGNQQPDGQQNGMMQPPEGFQPPDGDWMPDGTQPPDGSQPPDGTQAPDGVQPPDGMQQGGDQTRGNNQGMGNGGQGGFGMDGPAARQSSAGSLSGSSYNIPVLAGSTAFLLAGLIFVLKFKRVKYF
ncbi:MAG: Spore coat protein CotH [Eubacterium sp.]|nr:Spore coat protein CotH [Eubacterium sp.]